MLDTPFFSVSTECNYIADQNLSINIRPKLR